jgi:hypothetical protein
MTASSHVIARPPQNSANERRSETSPVRKKTNELRTASTRTATSIAATVVIERKSPWVIATHYNLQDLEGIEGSRRVVLRTSRVGGSRKSD